MIFEANEVIKEDGTPYTVFTPYSKKWKSMLDDFYLRPYPTETYFSNFFRQVPLRVPSLLSIGFHEPEQSFPSKHLEKEILKNTKKTGISRVRRARAVWVFIFGLGREYPQTGCLCNAIK